MHHIKDKNHVTVVGDYDIIIVGGGVAGVGAALAARRNGCRVLIIEKSVMLGGLATLGLIAIYLSLCDGKGKKVTGGIAEEFLHLSIKYGYNTLDPSWGDKDGVGAKERYKTAFSPPEFVFALDELMETEEIDILFDTLFCKPVMKNNQCEAIIVENKSGRTAYTGKMFIDASGDSDLLFRAGAGCVEEKNYLSYWFYNTNLEMMKKAVETGDIKEGISLVWCGKFGNDGSYDLGRKEYRGTDARDVTRFIINGRKKLKEEIDKNARGKGSLLALPGMAQFRRTRRLKGIYCLKEKDAMKRFKDSIGCTGHWLKPGIVYEIPYRTIVTRECINLFAAGRVISASGDAWEAVRVIPPAVLTGQAAGTAAALAIDEKCVAANVPIKVLQERLQQAGVIIHYHV